MPDESSLEGAHERTCIIVNKLTDPQTDEASGNPEAAMCVRKSSARRVLQFTPFNVASYVLHRPASRVIHRLQLYFSLLLSQDISKIFKGERVLYSTASLRTLGRSLSLCRERSASAESSQLLVTANTHSV